MPISDRRTIIPVTAWNGTAGFNDEKHPMSWEETEIMTVGLTKAPNRGRHPTEVILIKTMLSSLSKPFSTSRKFRELTYDRIFNFRRFRMTLNGTAFELAV
jgi:hypothetical protein